MLLSHLIAFLRRYLRYRQTLTALAAVDERTLRDIGLNRTQIIGAAWDTTR
jgi:uncharacterized protein YjiS (DUF1127 family)